MLFFLTRELWQTVRHFARKQAIQSGIWYWTSEDFGDEILLHSTDEEKSLSAVIKGAVETSRERISIIVASAELTDEFEEIVDQLASHPGNLRISMILTTRLDEPAIERCRDYLRRKQHLTSTVSTFLLASRIDSELNTLQPAAVEEDFRSFLLLLCGGREPLAEALGIFRTPVDLPAAELDDLQLDGFPSFRETGMVAAIGVRSWIPRKHEIIKLTQDLLSGLVAADEKLLAPNIRPRLMPASDVMQRALHLSQSDEPLGLQHFTGEIPPPPESPVETWRVPVSSRRARKERRHLRRVVQQDFTNYVASLEAIRDNIRGWLDQQCSAAFEQAARTYRSEVFEDTDLGTISFLLREYFPTFATDGVSPDDFADGPTGWPPDESQDCFSDVYEALEEGLEELPSSNSWTKAGAAALAFFVGAWVFRDAGWLIPLALTLAGLLCPVALVVHRTVRLSELRRQVVQLSDAIYSNLRRTFFAEIEHAILHSRMDLEHRIRMDATAFAEQLRDEFESIPLLTTTPDIDWDNLDEEIARLRTELIGVGVDELRFERLANRMGRLAKSIVQQAGGELPEGPEPVGEVGPREMAEEWLDELVGSSVLPLEKVEGLQDEILDVAASWRSPAFMAPLTDAEMCRGFRKVVIVPNTDIIYHQLQETLPRYSGNPVVNLQVWSGPVPGIAVCSVLAGLPDSVLDHLPQAHGRV